MCTDVGNTDCVFDEELWMEFCSPFLAVAEANSGIQNKSLFGVERVFYVN